MLRFMNYGMCYILWSSKNLKISDKLSYVASLLNLLKIYRNQVCVKEIQI